MAPSHAQSNPGPWSFALAALVAVLAILGWQLLSFTTDDAYIAFRYVSNAVEGHGLVWNPAPFQPVEGYTCFLWVVLLWLSWAALGVEPPMAANTLALGFGLGSLWLCWRLSRRMDLPSGLERWRLPIGTLVLVGITTNRTFLTWLSSGLETSLFNFCFLWWLYVVLSPTRTGRWLGLLSVSATLMALTRPDGMLAVGATLVVGLNLVVRRTMPGARVALATTPLLGFFAHLAWRRMYYGEWLPNTYYAKTVGAWPEAGGHYLLSFAIEHGAWLWGIALVGWLAWSLSSPRRLGAPAGGFPTLVGIGVVATHFTYYTWIVGGDHFEYRVYSHLVPLLFVSFCWLVTRLSARGAIVVPMLVLLGVAGNAVGWVHYTATQGHEGGFWPIADRFPAVLRPVLREFDRSQAWLDLRFICVRAQTHGAFAQVRLDGLPDRKSGLDVPWSTRPVQPGTAVGVQGWVMPNVAIIDAHGLNDWVVARTAPDRQNAPELITHEQMRGLFARFDADGDEKLDETEISAALDQVQPHLRGQGDVRTSNLAALLAIHDRDGDGAFDLAEFLTVPQSFRIDRRMAHERTPPEGYVEGFRPNVRIVDRRFVIADREPPLTDEEIREHESRYRQLILAEREGR